MVTVSVARLELSTGSACARASGDENSFSETCLLPPGCPLGEKTSIGQKLHFQTRLGDFLTLQSALPPRTVALNSPQKSTAISHGVDSSHLVDCSTAEAKSHLFLPKIPRTERRGEAAGGGTAV